MEAPEGFMGGVDAEERGRLIPGLLEDLVLAHIVPRLPWYTRPVCRALSKSWRATLDTRNPELDLRTRLIQLPLLRGLFLFCTFDQQIFIRDHSIHNSRRINAYQIQPHWRRLPPLNGLVAPPPTGAIMVASSGMVYVWSNDQWSKGGRPNVIVKLDIGRADWTWSKLPVPYTFNSAAVSMNDKIYVPGISARSSTDSPTQKKFALVHDMTMDKCAQVETWNQDELRVLSKCAHSDVRVEEMYSFVEKDFDTTLKLLMYDVESDSWRLREEVPIPEFRWPHLSEVKLLNSNCFEPPPDLGINIIWRDHESELISWFNSSVGINWVDIGYNPLLEGRYLEYIKFIGGSMYGIFCDEEDEEEDNKKNEEDGGGLFGLCRRTLMKGRIIVASSSVTWEEVDEVGFFQERYHVDTSVIQPIDWYTAMA